MRAFRFRVCLWPTTRRVYCNRAQKFYRIIMTSSIFTIWPGNFIIAFFIAIMRKVHSKMSLKDFSTMSTKFIWQARDRVNWQQGRWKWWIRQTQHTTRFRFRFRSVQLQFQPQMTSYAHWQARHVLKCWKTCGNLMFDRLMFVRDVTIIMQNKFHRWRR